MEQTEATQEPSAVEAEAASYRCPQCRAEMTYDAASQGLACAHCGHQLAIAGEEGQRNIVEHDLEHGLAAGAARGLGVAVRTTRCQECNATVSFEGAATSTMCEFCGSSQVLEQEENRNLIRPESVVPFHIDASNAKGAFDSWLGKLWFRPSALRSEKQEVRISGVYVPYWTFDADVHSDWTAQSGTYYYETESYTETDSQGNTVTKTRQVQKIRWRPAWGSRNDSYDDLLVCASKGLPSDLAARLRTFDTAQLQPYDPKFLAGWKAEEYAVSLNDAWTQALAEMERTQQSRCASDVPGDTHRALNVTNQFSSETFKHVLLPIWISSYRFNDKVYRFLVNGQTGEVTGKAPWSVFKILLAIAVAAAIMVGIYLIATR